MGINLTLDTNVRTLTDVWMGNLALRQCIKDRSIVLEGPSELKRAFPDWLALSVFADAS